MAQENNISRLAGTAGSVMTVVGVLIYFGAVFGFVPRTFIFVGAAIIIASFVAYFVEEFSSPR